VVAAVADCLAEYSTLPADSPDARAVALAARHFLANLGTYYLWAVEMGEHDDAGRLEPVRRAMRAGKTEKARRLLREILTTEGTDAA
jgi:hypothetical protein